MERNAKIRLAYSVFLGVFTVVVGVLFLAQAADLYYSGVSELGELHGMYSREAVGARLLELLTPVLLWIVAIVLGVVVYALFPASAAARMRTRTPKDSQRSSGSRRSALPCALPLRHSACSRR